METSPLMAFDLAATSGKRTAYNTVKMSGGFLSASCILVEAYSAARVASWVPGKRTAPALRSD